MTIIVTGAVGFIGSNIVKALNQRGITDIVAVDNLTKGENSKPCRVRNRPLPRQTRIYPPSEGTHFTLSNIEAVFIKARVPIR